MTTEAINWGIIGCGDVAEVKSGPAFQNCSNSKLLAVMRRNGDLARDFAERHQVPLWYDDADKLLENTDINAVYIATPPSTHLEFALKALRSGKDVYLEKPMVLSNKEASVLKNAVNKSKQKLVMAHYRRFLPMYLKVKDLVDENEYFEVITSHNDLSTVNDSLKLKEIEITNAEVTLRAETLVEIDEEMGEKVLKIMEFMDDLDDVQEVHTNAQFPDNFEPGE